MQPLDFGKFVVQLIQWFWDRCTFIIECKKGQAIIKKRFGYPIKWRNQSGWYWKWPFLDMFDVVDMRKKYTHFNAHSFHGNNMEPSVVPYNIIVDFQVEYQVINPLIIYDAYGFAQGEDEQWSYINNMVQTAVSGIIKEKGTSITYNDICSHLNNVSDSKKRETLSYEKSKEYDCKYKDMKNRDWEDIVQASDCVSINDIIVTSFDKNISLRTTV